MGMDVDLDAALKEAALETIASCSAKKACRPRMPTRSRASPSNYTVGEAVDQVQLVYGAIPKKIFTR